VQSLKYLMQQQATPPDEPRDIDWDAEFIKAEQQGRELVHDQQFYFDDKTMSVMANKLKEHKNFLATNPNLITSLEYNEYRLFLKTCQRKGIKPLIIVQPVNGWYFDYTGIDRAEREAVYDKLCAMAEEYGFTAYNPIELEYMPYAFFDMWHFGWKGWLYVDQEITEYFAEDR
jgi:D-alanine transfer protein